VEWTQKLRHGKWKFGDRRENGNSGTDGTVPILPRHTTVPKIGNVLSFPEFPKLIICRNFHLDLEISPAENERLPWSAPIARARFMLLA
jgi:hypothetical protein